MLNGRAGHLVIRYCPWCGTKLPDDLRDRWCEALRTAGVDDPLHEDAEKLPREFMTSAWYETRGL